MISVGGQTFSNYFKIWKQKFVNSLYFCAENIVSITTSQITDVIKMFTDTFFQQKSQLFINFGHVSGNDFFFYNYWHM